MVPEDGLVLGASDMPLEPGLWLAIVGDLQGRGAVTDLREVRHGVPHGNCAVHTAVTPGEEEE